MVFDNLWDIWPFQRGYFTTRNTRRHINQTSRYSNLKGQAEPLIQILGPWESNMIALQSILIWEKPGKSIVAILAANVIYWYLACSEIRFFFGVSLLSLVALLHHQWVYSIWPEISVPKSQSDQEEWTPVHPRVLSAPEVSRYLESTWNYVQEQQMRLTQLRRKQPGLFCALMLGLLSLLWLVGYLVSGVILLYIVLMVVMCGPAFVFHFVPKSTFKHAEQLIFAVFGKSGDSHSIENDLAEFLPEEGSLETQTALGIPLTSHEVKELNEDPKIVKKLQKARGRKNKFETKACEVSGNSFTAGLSESDFPSLEETQDTLEESDLALPEIVHNPFQPNSKLSTGEGMNFVTTHFDDSSDDDDEFAFGLSFNRTDSNPQQQFVPSPEFNVSHPSSSAAATAASLMMSQWMGNVVTSDATATVLTSLGAHLVSAIGSETIEEDPVEEEFNEKTTTRMTSSGSSLDEEFELISDDDLQ